MGRDIFQAFVGLLLLSTTLAGCTSVDDDGGPPSVVLDGLLEKPIVVNSSAYMQMRFVPRMGCGFQAIEQLATVSVYDVSGEVVRHEFHPPAAQEGWFNLTVSGAPPFVIAGNPAACAYPLYSEYHLDAPAYHVSDLPGRWRDRLWLNLTVPAGETVVEGHWEADDMTWLLWQTAPDLDDRQGSRSGEIVLFYPDGEVARTDRRGAFGSSTEYDPILMKQGQYKLRLTLDFPTTQPTSWPYFFDVYRFDREICSEAPISWPICSS